MAHAFFLGIDVDDEGADESMDVTLSIVEKEKGPTDSQAMFRLGHVRRYTERFSAEDLAERIQGLVAEQPYIGRTSIVVNREMEEGQALVTALVDRGLDPVAVTLRREGGTGAGEGAEGLPLDPIDAVQTIADLYWDKRFVIEDHTTEAASQLARGVQYASEVLDEADGTHDNPDGVGEIMTQLADVGTPVTSAAMATWLGTDRTFDPSQHLKEDPQTGRPDGRGA